MSSFFNVKKWFGFQGERERIKKMGKARNELRTSGGGMPGGEAKHLQFFKKGHLHELKKTGNQVLQKGFQTAPGQQKMQAPRCGLQPGKPTGNNGAQPGEAGYL